MATSINPWSAGAVVFNQQPWLSFYERQMMRKQARMDALDNYFRDLNKNVTPAGMRHQDVQQLLEKNADWQQKYQQNKAAILNPKLDGGRAYSDYMKGYQDQLGVIQESKDAAKDMDEIGKMKLDPKMAYVFEDPNFEDQVKKHELPIGHPDRVGINLATLQMPNRPFDDKEREAHQKYLTGGLTPDSIPGMPINIGDFRTQTPIVHQYSDKNLRAIGQRSNDAYDTDRRWRIEGVKALDEIMNDPVKHDQLNTLHKRIFGSDIDTPREALAAKDMAANMISHTEYKPGEDVYGRELAMAGVHHGYKMDEIQAREKMKNKSSQYQDVVIGGLYENLKTEALQPKNARDYWDEKGNKSTQYIMKASDPVKKMFAVPDDKGHLIYPDEVRYSDKFKNVTPIFYKYYPSDYSNEKLANKPMKDSKTGKTAVNHGLSQPILEEEFKERYKRQLMGTGAYGKTIVQKGEGDDDNENDPAGLGF